MKVLICGGRDFEDYDFLRKHLIHIQAERGVFTTIVHGAATGADTLAGKFAELHNIPCREYPADWKKYGRRAGPIRNKEMLERERPDLVVAFPGGTGTAHMVGLARNSRVPTVVVERS